LADPARGSASLASSSCPVMGLADAMRGFCVFYAWGVVMNATAELHRPAAPDQDAVTPAAAPRLPARQMVRAMVWAAVLGGLTAAIAAPHVDAALIPVLAVTGAGAGFVASIDIDTRHIYNRHIVVIAAARSEERRVGKGGRSRWWAE